MSRVPAGAEAGGGARRRSGRTVGRDQGAATVWAVGLMALIFMVAVVVMSAGTARVARHRAQSAADLSALAAARWALAAPERACAEAASLAEGNGARITRCSVHGDGIADVQVAVWLSLPVMGARRITADARAGPVHLADPAVSDHVFSGPRSPVTPSPG
ncbi:Rv3654c family TadE-like protein [Streptosporangium sp. NPDC087985]|uniref:Rv3654c family TadE-like protein n=1 Tax=Streptosporangium sp. NPDC087985 TaxID=3366196 RepID=UPI00380D4C4D